MILNTDIVSYSNLEKNIVLQVLSKFIFGIKSMDFWQDNLIWDKAMLCFVFDLLNCLYLPNETDASLIYQFTKSKTQHCLIST